jgi:hypothetical protein|tara:strand:- start:283 stop:504 length:222 start_codon:yes stop_codon:yes gene_type:complete
MLDTNIILKIVSYTYVEPSITVELTMPGRGDALDIADKLNAIAKAKKENTTKYIVQTIDLPNGREDSDDDMPF